MVGMLDLYLFCVERKILKHMVEIFDMCVFSILGGDPEAHGGNV